jgi:hypothetical protein
MAREFVAFIEQNHKENETFVFYLQWTGNEDALTRLEESVENAMYDDMDGDYSSFSMDTSVKLTEDAVKQMCRLKKFGTYSRMFTKCTGVFKCPFDERVSAEELDSIFYACKIERMFSEYRNLYSELLNGKITKEEYIKLKLN